MKMLSKIAFKLTHVHLLLIVIGVLLICSIFGGCLKEGMSNEDDEKSKDHEEAKDDKESKEHEKASDKEDTHGKYGNLDESSSPLSKHVKGPRGEDILATPENTVQGISKNQIPPGQEDLYILKSEIVPPVCPACPSTSVCPREKPCPACPPCGRCPEPAFECKKVPNYQASMGPKMEARPVLSDFSQFGL